MSAPTSFRVADRSSVSEARRAVGARARLLGWQDTACGESEIVATELATNLVKYARDGVLAIASPPGATDEMVVVAIDRGPGMADVQRSFTDGYSTSGSPGTGLGAVQRLSYRTEVLSSGEGTILVARLRDRASGGPHLPNGRIAQVAGFTLAKEGQVLCGDAWSYRWLERQLAVVVCDGLGHGYEAHKAASRAIECFDRGQWQTPQQFMTLANEALRPTRGAAAAVAMIDTQRRRVRFCGVGNIVAGVVAEGRAHHMVSHNGILGAASRMAEFDYAWPADATLLMHSDGLMSRWPTPRWEGIWQHHPAVIGGVLYRDLLRGTDDVAVVAVVAVAEHAAAS